MPSLLRWSAGGQVVSFDRDGHRTHGVYLLQERRSHLSQKSRMEHPDKSRQRRTLGLCIGAATISAVVLEHCIDAAEDSPWQVVESTSRAHLGDPETHLRDLLAHWQEESFAGAAVTGGRFSQRVNLTRIPEPWAVEQALTLPDIQGRGFQAVLALGGEGFLVYPLTPGGQISGVVAGSTCASGTGEFFLQQVRRLGISLEAAVSLPWVADPYPVSGRCSVFCKSDCTHAANKGVDREKIVAGLCRMMAGKVMELLVKARTSGAVLLTGGVTRNRLMLEYLRREHPQVAVSSWATCFEALGAAIWAMTHVTLPLPARDQFILQRTQTFSSLPPLATHAHLVTSKTLSRQTPHPGDRCVLGLDVGSTTTKAVLLRSNDQAFLAAIYLRTNGDPVGAARACYRAIRQQLAAALPDASDVVIEGLGITGSGRQIAGLHAHATGIINEIVAHATAAAHFDPEVETLFEIGGQDAKYTRLAHGVPIDYAMNEACAAGTGSFLEEAAWETLGVSLQEIATAAMRGERIPTFSDQCAAFIATDVNNAVHSGCSREEIVAGLVYAIGINYLHRVKGQRPVGRRVFMQGGVCYNHAVPLAMAGLLGVPIVVPPEPGLMGALGVALQIERRLRDATMAAGHFDLQKLADKEIHITRHFTCPGTQMACDRHCDIAVFEVEGHRVPFGGACNKYVNARQHLRVDAAALDRVMARRDTQLAASRMEVKAARGRVGLNRSFMLHQFQPLYTHFFAALGWQPLVPETCSPAGIERRNAALCHPAELAHGYLHTLLNLDDPPDYLFLPHFRAVPAQPGHTFSQACPIVQAEPFYVQAAFRPELTALQQRGVRILSPLLDFTHGLEGGVAPLMEMAREMGISLSLAAMAWQTAAQKQRAWEQTLLAEGERTLATLEQHSEQTGIVLFSRPYGGLTPDANLGISTKFATRGMPTLAFDQLPAHADPAKENMYWGLGQKLLKATRFTARHPRLFGVFITYFGCGPDSFILGYFREIMEAQHKPFLILELDGHTADAGLETRIEAFLDVVVGHQKVALANLASKERGISMRHNSAPFQDEPGYESPCQGFAPNPTRALSRTCQGASPLDPDAFQDKPGYESLCQGFAPNPTRTLSWTCQGASPLDPDALPNTWAATSILEKMPRPPVAAQPGVATAHLPPARLFFRHGRAWVITASGAKIPASDPRVKVLVPWVGLFFTEALTTALRLVGFHAIGHGAADATVLQRGRAHVSGRECLPLILTTGMLVQHLETRTDPHEILLYFMPTASGPCRFGQYAIFMEDLVRRLAKPDVFLLSLTSENSYGGLGTRFSRFTWWGILLADMMEEVRAMLLANAQEPEAALTTLQHTWRPVLDAMATGTLAALEKALTSAAARLAAIPLRRPVEEVPLVALSGEIYVRRDPFSRGFLVQRLAERGFATLPTGIAEWVHYSNALVDAGQVDGHMSVWEKMVFA
ncbi:MAG: hypothetical protein HQL62_03210, partial [Magnetococcales bacterium]|nr:hypothetical protein [Magnetococcales bacterium]